MRSILFILLLFFGHASLAQTDATSGCVSNVTLSDTIHISGIVKYSSGKPVKDAHVSNKLVSYGVFTYTDSAGRFHLENVSPVDTLTINVPGHFTRIKNNGSRFLSIIIPDQRPFSNISVQIEAAAKTQKQPLNMKFVDTCACCCSQSEVYPEYPGGILKLQKFVESNLIYPERSLTENIEGEVIVQFSVGANGMAKDFSIVSGLNAECDQAALDVLKKMPKWKPAIYYGKLVDYPQMISIDFTIKRQKP